MLDSLLVPIAILYFLVVGALFIYGTNFFYLSFMAWRHSRSAAVLPPALKHCPAVTVQLPVYNELYVVERLIAAAAALDYPADRLEIQVLDDSTDETTAIAARAVSQARARGVNIVHLHRTVRTGFKAGALQAGLARAKGEFVAIFDADFVPPPDFLWRALPHFQNERVAFVQTRWGHLNRDYSLLTSLQSLAIDAHFMVEQFSRSQGGFLFNFNGTGGIWRRAALLDAGGWTADTLTEDLDLSYRAYLSGWEGRYLRDLEVKAELPVSFSAFRRQQHRWARGSFECFAKLGPRVWRADLSITRKFQATLHLTGYGVHLLLFGLTLLYPIVLLLAQRYSAPANLFGIAYLFNVTALAPTLFFIVGQQQLDRKWWRALPRILFVTVMGSGLMLNTVRAAWHILVDRESVFERTAKYGIEGFWQDWTRRRYQRKLESIVVYELALALYCLGTLVLALYHGNWIIAFYAGLFCMGLLFVSSMSIAQAVVVATHQGRIKRPVGTRVAPTINRSRRRLQGGKAHPSSTTSPLE